MMEGGMAIEWQRDEYRLSTDPAAVDTDVVHGFLRESYWARGIPLEIVQRSLAHSLNFSLLHAQQQVGFARVITDYATFAYVGDVFVLPEHRGQRLATWMMQCVVAHPDLQGLRRWCLATRDAQHVYARVGFQPIATPERWMEIRDPAVYQRASDQKTSP
jgi:GNAT superfamily N-acetyltransferase